MNTNKSIITAGGNTNYDNQILQSIIQEGLELSEAYSYAKANGAQNPAEVLAAYAAFCDEAEQQGVASDEPATDLEVALALISKALNIPTADNPVKSIENILIKIKEMQADNTQQASNAGELDVELRKEISMYAKAILEVVGSDIEE